MIHHNDTYDFRPAEYAKSEHQRLRIAVRRGDGVETFTFLAHAFQIDKGKHGLEVTIYQEICKAFNRKPVVQIFVDWMSYDLDNMPGKGWSDLYIWSKNNEQTPMPIDPETFRKNFFQYPNEDADD